MTYSSAQDSDDAADEPYEVGYGRPPKQYQFKKGAPSPNPRGRPPGSQNHNTLIEKVALESREYTEGGRVKSATTVELVLLAVRNATAKGSLAAINLHQAIAREAAPEIDGIQKGVLITRPKLDNDEWSAVYGDEMSDDEAAERYPYLLLQRRAFRAHQSATEDLISLAESES